MCAATIFSSFFLGIGDSRTPLYVTVVVNILNALLDYALIYGELGMPALGVSGAAVATSLVGVDLRIGALRALPQPINDARTYATDLVLPHLESMRRLLRVGLPIGGQYAIEMLSFAAFLTLVARMGDASMAASQAFIALLSISFMQAEGLSIGVCTLVGRYMGAMNLAAAARSYRSAQILALFIAGTRGRALHLPARSPAPDLHRRSGGAAPCQASSRGGCDLPVLRRLRDRRRRRIAGRR